MLRPNLTTDKTRKLIKKSYILGRVGFIQSHSGHLRDPTRVRGL